MITLGHLVSQAIAVIPDQASADTPEEAAILDGRAGRVLVGLADIAGTAASVSQAIPVKMDISVLMENPDTAVIPGLAFQVTQELQDIMDYQGHQEKVGQAAIADSQATAASPAQAGTPASPGTQVHLGIMARMVCPGILGFLAFLVLVLFGVVLGTRDLFLITLTTLLAVMGLPMFVFCPMSPRLIHRSQMSPGEDLTGKHTGRSSLRGLLGKDLGSDPRSLITRMIRSVVVGLPMFVFCLTYPASILHGLTSRAQEQIGILIGNSL